MKTNSSMDDLEYRATEALRTLLGQVSVIKLKEIRRAPDGPMLARVDVLGHSHTLACEINSSARPESLRDALEALRNDAAQCEAAATPVLIAPYLSPEAQALCKERSASYLDLQGNARLALGEVFIGKRSSAGGANRASTQATPTQSLRRFPPTKIPPAGNGRSAIA